MFAEYTADRFVVAPKQVSRGCIDSDQPLCKQAHVLPDAANLDDDCQRETRIVAVRYRAFPDQVSCVLGQRDHGGLGAAGRANESWPVNQRRFRVGPYRMFAAEVAGQVLFPADGAGFGIKTCQIAVGARA